MPWNIELVDGIEGRLKRFHRKYKPSMDNAYENMHRYVEALQAGQRPMQIKGKSIHPEKIHGVYSLDQTGPGARLPPVRIYTYPDEQTETLWVLTVGDKASQAKVDLPRCRHFVEKLLRERGGDSNG